MHSATPPPDVDSSAASENPGKGRGGSGVSSQICRNSHETQAHKLQNLPSAYGMACEKPPGRSLGLAASAGAQTYFLLGRMNVVIPAKTLLNVNGAFAAELVHPRLETSVRSALRPPSKPVPYIPS